MSLLNLSGDVLMPSAQKVGERVARKIFDARGNHIEAHLTEYELALAIATGVQVALNLAAAKLTAKSAVRS